LEILEKSAAKLQKKYLKVVGAKTFSITQAVKLIDESDDLEQKIAAAMVGAESDVVLRLKSLTAQFAAMRAKLLATPQVSKTGVSRELLRRELVREILEKVFTVLSDHLETKQYEEVKEAIEKRVRAISP
jgi:hypothetical protein